MILVTDRETHKSRGFGYVVFTNGEDAKEAMESMAGERGKVCMLLFTWTECVCFVHCYCFCITREMCEILPGILQTLC